VDFVKIQHFPQRPVLEQAVQDRGGSRDVPAPDCNMMNDPYFYPLGTAGWIFPPS